MNTESKEIKAAIKQVKADMRAKGIRRISCFNGGLNSDERYYNQWLFNLKTELSKSQQITKKN